MFPVGDQVEVVGELNGAGQLLQDVYAEALAAQFGVGLRVADDAERWKSRTYLNTVVLNHLLIQSPLWQQGLLLFLASSTKEVCFRE